MKIDPVRYDLSKKTLCLIILWLGLRASEPGKIRKMDIEFERRKIILRDTKSGGDQLAPLPEELVRPLQQLTTSLSPQDFVFINQHGTGIRRPQVEEQIRLWGYERGIKGLTPQIIRRSLAEILEDRGASVLQLECLLRHTGSSTLRRHYSTTRNLRAAAKALKYHPSRLLPKDRDPDSSDEM